MTEEEAVEILRILQLLALAIPVVEKALPPGMGDFAGYELFAEGMKADGDVLHQVFNLMGAMKEAGIEPDSLEGVFIIG